MYIYYMNIFLFILPFNAFAYKNEKSYMDIKKNHYVKNRENKYILKKKEKPFKTNKIKFYKNEYNKKRLGNINNSNNVDSAFIKKKNEIFRGKKIWNTKVLKKSFYSFINSRFLYIANNSLSSSLQNMLDKYCHPYISRCDSNKNCFCCNPQMIDYRFHTKSCLDNCGNAENCYGCQFRGSETVIPSMYISNKIILTCVVSSVQRKLDKLCGDNKVLRSTGSKMYCIPYDALDMSVSGFFCFNYTKNIKCLGFFRDTYENISDYIYDNPILVLSTINDFCDETLEGNGGKYIGCQSVSISKRKCLQWNTLNIATFSGTNMVHNHCRNPEQLETIYCFVRKKGFIVREYCEPKNDIILNKISYSAGSEFDFDITMKNVSDFRIFLFKNKCNFQYMNYQDPNKFIMHYKKNFTYHQIDNEIYLTINFKKFTYAPTIYNNFSICACYRDYYSNEETSCLLKKFKTEIGNFIVDIPIYFNGRNTIYIDEYTHFSFNLGNVDFKNDVYIYKGDYSYECNSLNLTNKTPYSDLNRLINADKNELIQKIYPPVDNKKNYSFIYGHFDKILTLNNLIKKNNYYIKQRKLYDDTYFQEMNNLKKGNNLICIKYKFGNDHDYYYSGRIVYNDLGFSPLKYILKKENTIYENIIYLKTSNSLNNLKYFSINSDNCEDVDMQKLREVDMPIVEENQLNRLKHYLQMYPYDYYKSIYSGDKMYAFSFFNRQEKLYYILIKNFSKIISPINYLCIRNDNSNKLNTVSLLNFSDLFFVKFNEFAHYFDVYTLPTNIHNYYLHNNSYYFITDIFKMNELSTSFRDGNLLSIWSHEKDDFISLWFIGPKALTPFFLIKYQLKSPKFTFIDFVNKNQTHYSAFFYVFNEKQKKVKKYDTKDFSSLRLVKEIEYSSLDKVVYIEKISHVKYTYFLLLNENNTISILDSNFNRLPSINLQKKSTDIMNPIKLQCLKKSNIVCFILYKSHNILWINIFFVVRKKSRNLKSNDLSQKELNNPNNNNKNHKKVPRTILGGARAIEKRKRRKKRKKILKSSSLLSSNSDERARVYTRRVYLYKEINSDILVEIPNDMTVISKLNEFIIYKSIKGSNKLYIYSTDRNDNTIAYYKPIKNYILFDYKIVYTFSYFFMNKNFISSLVTKENEKHAICSFVHENLSRTKIIYKTRAWYIYNKFIEIKPIIVGDKRQIKYFSIQYDDIFKGQSINIDKKSGLIQIQLDKIKTLRVKINIFMHGLFHIYETSITFNTVCEEGKYYKNDGCHPCERGYYNNLIEIKKDVIHFRKCTPCEQNTTTLIEVAVSKAECLCDVGYEYIKNPVYPYNFTCSPCPKGKYKNTISNEFCQGNGCKENSTSFFTGARTALEALCSCDAGFFLYYGHSGSEFCKKCLQDHYCPGSLIGMKKCPPNNKTVPEKNGSAVSVDSCFCKKGYEPIDMSKVNIKGTSYYHYYKTFFRKNNYKQGQLSPRHICIECDLGFYKDTISFEPCKKCPENSTNNAKGSTSVKKCNSCFSGYYKSSNKGCVKCLPNHFCVGSSSEDDLVQYIGGAAPCPNNSITVEPYEKNVSFKDCLCIEGYIKADQTTYSLNGHCKPVPLNFYKDTISNDLGKPCPLNSITLNVGAKSEKECICNKGYYYDKTEKGCVECPIGYYCLAKKMKNKFMKPKKCPQNSANIKKGLSKLQNCKCNFGYTSNIINNLTGNKLNKTNKRNNKFSFYNFDNIFYIKDINTLKKYATYKIEKYMQSGRNGSSKLNTDDILLCIKCPLSTYKSIISNNTCDMCRKNSSTSHKFTNSDIFFCMCNPGYYLDEQTCKPCSFNNIYCSGEKIFIISEDIYEEIIKDIKGKISLLTGGGNLKDIINSVIDKYDSNFSNTKTKGNFPNIDNHNNLHNHNKISSTIQNYYESIDLSNKKNLVNLNKNTNKDESLRKLLKNYFYKDHENIRYAKYQKLVKCQTNTEIPLGVDSSYTFDDCKCSKGYYLESKDSSKSIKICKPCKEGTFKNYVGDETFCVSCPSKSTSLEGSIYPTHCFCKEGFFYSNENCLECLEGATCKGGLYENAMNRIQSDLKNVLITKDDHVKPESKKGYFLDENVSFVDVSEWKFIKCPINGSCLEKNKCHFTMNNYLCIECTKGYTNGFMRSLCVKCPNNSVNVIVLFIIYIIFCFIIIIISYLNISSGFYRKSIHSIVIKIAVNYISCMLVIAVLKENNLLLPTYVLYFYKKINKLINRDENRKIVSVDCLLRHYFNISYSDSYLYTSLIFFLIPVFLIISLTIILFVILKVYRFIKKKAIANRLNLLRIAKNKNIYFLSNSLEKAYSKERFIMILRYIKLEHYKLTDRILIFFEDMIPVYVTFLFIIHAKTSLRMFQLFDCSYIKYSNNSGKYILSRASSIQCDLKTEYFKFFMLGLLGTVVWSLGIPLFSFFVLYINRHNLFHENVRIKYGFLHNGYLHNRWYWETIVFIRKISVLFITTVILFPADETNASRLLVVTFVAIFSLCVHSVFQPFDKRNFFTLNKLENFSLYIWVSTIIVISILLSMNLNELFNFIVIFFLGLLHVIFIVKLLFCLFYECVENIRRKKACYNVPVIGTYAKLLGEVVEKRKKQEPLIYYDKTSRRIAIILSECAIKKKNKVYNFAKSFHDMFKSISNFYKNKKGYMKLRNNLDEENEEIQKKINKKKLLENENNFVPKGCIMRNELVDNNESSYRDFMEYQRISFFSFLNSANTSIYENINKECRMFVIEIYKELLNIFLKNVTLTYISDIFFEFIFKISINIGNLIDNLDQKERIFESLNTEQNVDDIIQWSLERKEKYKENEKLEESKFISYKSHKSKYKLSEEKYKDHQYSLSCSEEELTNSNDYEEKKKKTRRKKIYVSKEEKERLFFFFRDDLLNRKIELSEFYFILIELKLKYFSNLSSYFYMFKIYKKLEKKLERKKLRKLDEKLKKCQSINSQKKVKKENLDKHIIKEKIPMLYAEFKDLSKLINQLKNRYIDLNKNKCQQYSSNEGIDTYLDDDISLSSQDSFEEDLMTEGLELCKNKNKLDSFKL